MKNFIVGKTSDYQQQKGWITGCFFPEELLNHDKNIEVKVDYFDGTHTFPKHHHSKRKTWTLVLQGEMHLKIDDEEVILQTGEFIIFNPGVSEELISVKPGTIAVSIHTPSLAENDKVSQD